MKYLLVNRPGEAPYKAAGPFPESGLRHWIQHTVDNSSEGVIEFNVVDKADIPEGTPIRENQGYILKEL